MRLEVKYPTGSRHVVRLPGALTVLGRDPGCDLVLNDVKCSRRHAVLEIDAQGLVVRDTGSANGVFVNGKKAERARLEVGDVLRLGDVVLKVLGEEAAGTIVTAPEDVMVLDADPAAPPPAPGPSRLDSGTLPVTIPPPPRSPTPKPPPPASPLDRPLPPPAAELQQTEPEQLARPGPTAPLPRPLTVTMLAVLWALALALFTAVGVASPFTGLSALTAAAGAGLGLLLAALSGVMALGLWRRASWARTLQIGLAALGVFVCPFTLAAGATLVYMLRPEIRIQFSGPTRLSELSAAESSAVRTGSAEGAFAFAILGTLVVGVVVTALLGFLALRPVR